jgi:hypothetical protein
VKLAYSGSKNFLRIGWHNTIVGEHLTKQMHRTPTQ